MADTEWFLSAERGNAATELDRRRGDGLAWSAGNAVTPLVHGATYFARLAEVLNAIGLPFRSSAIWTMIRPWDGKPT